MAVHGATQSKELAILLHKFGIGLSYQGTLDLETDWAILELDEVSKCRFLLYISGKWSRKYIEV